MSALRLVIWIISAGLMVTGSGGVSSQDYPSKAIRIVTHEAGGTPDFVSRLIAQGISGPLGQQVIVENRPTGVIPGEIVAKARPGELNYASSGTGTVSHLAGELFKSMGGVNIVRIPYRGAGPAINDLISGQVQVTFYSATSVMPHVKAGRLRALAVTSAQPSALFPELPTAAATGLPGYESGASYGIYAPAKTPETIINRLNQEIARVLNRAEVKEKLSMAGSEIVASAPERLAATMKSEMVRMGKVIKDAGIKAD